MLDARHMNIDAPAVFQDKIGQVQIESGEWVSLPEGEEAFALYRKTLASPTAEDFAALREELIQFAAHDQTGGVADLVRYLDREWWPHKRLCIKAWTKTILHYGFTTTSPGESDHAALKNWLRTSRSNILTLLEKV